MLNLKYLLKKNKFISKSYSKLRPIIVPVLSVTSYSIACRFLYFETFGKLPNLKNPKKFSEKLTWLSLHTYRKDPLVAKCADKYAVREYIIEKEYDNILNEIYGVWDKVEDIDWDLLPEKFAIKCNHGSGYNIVCHSKKKFDIEKAKKTLDKWMNTEYWKKSGEIFYKDIQKKIICERFIETKDGFPPNDYKIFCSNGKPQFIFVASERVGKDVNFDFFTCDWEWIPVKNTHPNSEKVIEKPKNLSEMLEIAEKLSEPWPQVRVDLYSEDNKIIFGELTFLHMAGRGQFEPAKYDDIFGDCISLPQ